MKSNKLAVIIGLFILYNIFLTIYNMKRNNLSGVQAIPHIEFYRKAPGVFLDTLNLMITKFLMGLAYARRYAKEKYETYK